MPEFQSRKSWKGCVNPMHKIGIVGDYESVMGFSAVGLSAFPVSDQKEASDVLKKLIKDEYAVIYITEDLFIKDDLKKAKEQSLPIIIPVPGIKGKSGVGMNNLRDMAIRAIGSDIIFNANQGEQL